MLTPAGYDVKSDYLNLANQWQYRQDNVSSYHNAVFPPSELLRSAISYRPQHTLNGNNETTKNNEQKKQMKDSPYSYNSKYNMPYIKSAIDVSRQRAKIFYRELGDYVTRLIRKFKTKSKGNASYETLDDIVDAAA